MGLFICFAPAASPVWRRGKATGLYADKSFCDACGTHDKRHGLDINDLGQEVHHHTLCVTLSQTTFAKCALRFVRLEAPHTLSESLQKA